MSNVDHPFDYGAQGSLSTEGAIQSWLQEKLGELIGVEPTRIDINRPFNEYGLASADAVGLSGELTEATGCPLSPTIVYDYPTITLLARYIATAETTPEQLPGEQDASTLPAEEAIAIIGMACRFPGGATTPEAFWQLLREGKSAVAEIPSQRWDSEAYYDPSPDTPGKMYTRYGCFLEEIDGFDANFFGISPHEALRMDPQQRLLVEVAWEAVENAGLAMPALAGSRTGVFIGMMSNHEYSQIQMQQGDDAYQDDPHFGTGSASSVASGRLAYLFDWQGPTLTIDTACSSSLVSLHFACQSLRKRECAQALVGGVHAVLLPETMVSACKMGMLSIDGRCKTFDAAADGFVLGEGCGAVVLKPLAEAIADKNPVLAIIRGSAVNQDGRSNGLTAPNKLAQEAVIRQALARAGVKPCDVSYVEAHGSGTALGDPIEIAALEAVFGEERSPEQPLMVGAVKTNIGHLVGAAGIAGLIKTVLSLQHDEIPPHLNLQQLNPHVSRVRKHTVIPTEPTAWHTQQQTRLAGVSSFGWSGTNAHVVLEEAPRSENIQTAAVPSHLLLLSAQTETALERATDNLAAWIQEHPAVPLAHIAHTLQSGRRAFLHRCMLACHDSEEAITALRTRGAQHVVTSTNSTQRSVAFLFPGVGEQYIDLALELYQVEATFRDIVDHCCALLKEELGLELRDVIFSPTARSNPSYSNGKAAGTTQRGSVDLKKILKRDAAPSAFERLKQTMVAQPAAFIIEYALARLLEKWGLRPAAMLGYSLGEYVAACIAGVFSLEDALLLVAQRAQMIQRMPVGAMVAVFLSEQEVQPYLSHDICLAAVNAPATCVLAGPVQAIERLEARLSSREIAHRRLETTHAFHSNMLEPVREQLMRLLGRMRLHAPQIPYVSNVTGTWITAEQATDAAYWARHMCETVRLTDGIGALLQEANMLLLEVGPGQSLSSFVKQHPSCTREHAKLVFSTLPTAFEAQSDYTSLLTAVGKMWLVGARIDWSGFSAEKQVQTVPLPNYPFEHQRYWIERQGSQKTSAKTRGKQELARWFSLPAWKQIAPARPKQPTAGEEECWVFFLDTCSIGQRIIEHCTPSTVVTVVQGTSFNKYGDTEYAVRPGERADYEALFRELQMQGKLPRRIVHMWMVTPGATAEGYDSEKMLETGFYSILALTQALGELDLQACHISIISTEMQNVVGDELVCPEKSLVIGPCRIIPQEYSTLSCSCIDIALPAQGMPQENAPLRQLIAELTSEQEHPIVALRGNRRWIQTFEPVMLDKQEQSSSLLREGGVYLITGGLGGIGLALSEHLVHRVGARLVLVGRSALPPRHSWDQVMARADDPTQGIARTISAIRAMEAQGANILMLQADVTSEEQMSAVIAQTLETFGALHGVVHAAGVPGMGLMQLKTKEQAKNVLAPKVQGTRVLQRVLKRQLPDQKLDFLVLCSSITAITGGGPGQVDYAGASAFLDAYAQRYAEEQSPVISINWGEWQWNAWEAGLAGYDAQTQTFLREHRHQFGISFAEGAEAFARILSAWLPHVVVSPQDIHTLIAMCASYTANTMLQKDAAHMRATYARPELATSYIAPRNDAERKMANLWGEHLGIEQVGIHDNFFELGGNSLIGMELVRQIRKAFQVVDLPPHMLYEAPTVHFMMQLLEQQQQPAASTEERTRERSEKRRERRKQRAQDIKKAS
ncbi:MAG TPA: SDR family NAD(P)-dependent oxidoreductase [Ktedonobacteraceae bacterium]|nr:SDR family NAD(P)-dependent oxidoreductase [Ktedonobacteraceae bacterium]